MTALSDWVIVAESNPAKAAEYRHLLDVLGFDVELVRNGPEVAPLLKRTPPPVLLFINLSLPVVDGLTVIHQLRRSRPDVPVIAVTSVPRLRTAVADLRLPNVVVLPAGFSPIQFEEAARKLLGRSHGTAATRRAALPTTSVGYSLRSILQSLADDLVATFSPAISSVGVMVSGQTWLAMSVKACARPIAPSLPFLEWPFVRDAAAARELIVIPDLRDNSAFTGDAWPPAGTFRGLAIMPITSRAGITVGAACLLDPEPLTLDATALHTFESRVRAAAAELERHIATQTAAHQVFTAHRELEGARARADAQIATLSELAVKDGLTGLLNRRGGEEAITRELARIQRTRGRSSILMLDVDLFKQINDTYGHAAGDRVLSEIAKMFGRLQRTSDVAIRWGGEEFVILLPDIDLAGARRFGERLRSAVERLRFSGIGAVTISGGAAEMSPDETVELVIARADQSLYGAKRDGRNRIR